MSAPSPDVQRIGVIGAGTMGVGIATSCATSGLDVTLIDTELPALENGVRRIRASVEGAVKKGRLAAEAGAAGQARVAVTTDMAVLGAVDLVIEAVFESLQLKQDVFRKLDAICPPGTLLATNTSTL